jgi:hypothetical protein
MITTDIRCAIHTRKTTEEGLNQGEDISPIWDGFALRPFTKAWQPVTGLPR